MNHDTRNDEFDNNCENAQKPHKSIFSSNL